LLLDGHAGFTDVLSHAGVRWLAASPETMLAPGVPTTVAEAIVRHPHDPAAIARDVVHTVMAQRYFTRSSEGYGPAAAVDVLDCDPAKVPAVRSAPPNSIGHSLDKARRGLCMLRIVEMSPHHCSMFPNVQA
jgi:hypothetical protein